MDKGAAKAEEGTPAPRGVHKLHIRQHGHDGHHRQMV